MKKEFKIGLAGIAALVILFCGIHYLKGINMFKPESYYLVEFENVNGLPESSPVFANGFKVGIVRDLRYNYQKPGHVLVGVELDQHMKVPKGSRAELVTEMLGTVKMNLLLNLESAEYYGENDTIPGFANNGIMGAAEKDLLPQLQRMMPKMDSILGSLNKLLADPALANTLHNAEQLTASLSAASLQLDKMMNTDVPQLLDNVNVTASNLQSISNNLKDVDFASTISKVDSTLANVRLLTDKLNRKDNTLGLLMNDSSLYKNLNATSANAASLLEDVKAHPKRYVHFSLFGKKDK